MKNRFFLLAFLYFALIGVNLYGQSEWEENKKTMPFRVLSSDGLNINNFTHVCTMWNTRATTKEQEKSHKISYQIGELTISDFHNDVQTTQRKKKLVIDIHDDHPDPTNRKYKVYNDKGRDEWVSGIIYWGLRVDFRGTDGKYYYVGAWYSNIGSFNKVLTYREAQTDINTYGNIPYKGEFDNDWEMHSSSSDCMPDGVSITYDTNGLTYIQFGHTYPTQTFTIPKVSSITSLKFNIGSGAGITVSNYRILTESIYSKVKTHILSGNEQYEKENYLEAVEKYSKAIDGGYENYDIYYRRASAYFYAQFYSNAIDDYTKALSFESSENAYLYRGLAKLQKRDISCIEDLKKGGTKGQALVRELEINDTNPEDGASIHSQYKASGTGIIIDSRGFIATNYHVIDGANRIDIYITSNEKTTTYAAVPVIVDKSNDLAIIKINDSKFAPTSPVPYSFGIGTKDVGTTVFAMGYPELSYLGEEIKVTDGIISSKTGYQGDITTYQISAPIQHGNSGGPLFDEKGYLVGITNAGVESLQNVGYAIKVSYLNNLIEACPEIIYPPQSNQITNLSLPEKVKRLSPYVTIIKIK